MYCHRVLQVDPGSRYRHGKRARLRAACGPTAAGKGALRPRANLKRCQHGPIFPALLKVPAFLKVIPSLSQAREAAQAAANAAALALVSPAAGQPGSVRGARKRKPTARASEAARPSLIPSLANRPYR